MVYVCVKICRINSTILKVKSNKRQETINCVLCVISIDNLQNIHPSMFIHGIPHNNNSVLSSSSEHFI